MPYRFAQEREDYSDLASGQVLYGLPGAPALPVRLASEIFQRCLAQRARLGLAGPVAVYDPCCGAAYHLAALGLLHGPQIAGITASDLDAAALPVARQNLDLLSARGLDRRIEEIAELLKRYEKDSHRAALASAQRLRERLRQTEAIATEVFQADALDEAALAAHLKGRPVDIVIADVPYGQRSHWRAAHGTTPLQQMLAALLGVLTPASVVAIAADKAQKAQHLEYQRLEQFQIGKRRVVILRPTG